LEKNGSQREKNTASGKRNPAWGESLRGARGDHTSGKFLSKNFRRIVASPTILERTRKNRRRTKLPREIRTNTVHEKDEGMPVETQRGGGAGEERVQVKLLRGNRKNTGTRRRELLKQQAWVNRRPNMRNNHTKKQKKKKKTKNKKNKPREGRRNKKSVTIITHPRQSPWGALTPP